MARCATRRTLRLPHKTSNSRSRLALLVTGEGATVEHILPRSLGGANDPRNLGIAHPGCNGEKGRRWGPKRRHRGRSDEYAALLDRLRAERARRWRESATQPAEGASTR